MTRQFLKWPEGVREGHIAVTGKTGSGKTYTARTMVEGLLDDRARVCVIDPTGVWWGLKSTADGQAPGFPVAIFGGNHADVPITDKQGAKLGEIVGTSDLQCVIDVSEFTMGERRRFMVGFTEALYQHNRATLFLILDEADEFAPQRPMPDQTLMLHRIDQIVRRGRSRGFRVTMITQRPAVLSKDVLSQAATLIAMKLTAPQDRKALGAWVEGQADAVRWKEIQAELPRLKVGEGFLWFPEGDILARYKFPSISTFDSGRTPKAGERQRGAVRVADVDLATIRAALSAVVDKPKVGAVAGGVAEAQVRAREQAAHADGRAQGRTELALEIGPHIDAIFSALIAAGVSRKPAVSVGFDTTQPRARLAAALETALSPAPAPKRAAPARSLGNGIHPAAERMIRALARQSPPPAPLPDVAPFFAWEEIAMLAGMVPGNGFYYHGRKELLAREWVAGDDRVTITPAGREASRTEYAPMLPGDIVELWRAKLAPPSADMLGAIFGMAGEGISVAALAETIGRKPGNGFWYAGLKRLRAAGLIAQQGDRITVTELLR